MQNSTPKPLVYLASPYSASHLPARDRIPVEASRYKKVLDFLAMQLVDRNYTFFCPIVYSHPLVPLLPTELAFSHTFWLEQDFAILKHCQQLWVYMIPGWKESNGIKKEMEFAQKHNIPVFYIEEEKEYA